MRDAQPFISIEAEQSILGALLVDNSAWDRVADLLKADDFSRREHRLIFDAIGRLINSMKPADVVTVLEELRRTGDEDENGSLTYLNELAGSVPGARNIRRYAEIVRERAILRGLVAKADQVHEIAASDKTLSEKADIIAGLFSGADAMNSRKGPRLMQDILCRVIDAINDAADGGEEFWRTGIPGLDSRLSGGLRAGDVVILAARPSVGKTSLSLQIAKRFASDDHPALILSQEMPDVAIARRALSSESAVSMGHIKTGKLSDDEWSRVSDGIDKLGRLCLHVDDEPALTPQAIGAKARSVKGLKLLVLDYIQLSEGEGDNRTQQVGAISRALKRLAKELGMAVIALSQLNRAVDARPGRRPQMSDLRDSGEIEQDADVIAFLWPLETDDSAQIRPIGLDIAKNRDGERGAVVLNLHGATQTWTESTQSIDEFQTTKKRQGGFE
jgi:replicative DNA helicase